MSDLIDTTEMYLRTIYELSEEGIAPMRARIAERLHQSGPTVSQTVARMERDGLVTVGDDRLLHLTPRGEQIATSVMRKHRLAERLLVDVIGLDMAQVHDEACRWEHVMSDEVERRLIEILDEPGESPFGNPIPGLVELGVDMPTIDFRDGVDPLLDLLDGEEEMTVRIRRISETVQADADHVAELSRAGIVPGATVAVRRGGVGVWLGVQGQEPVDVIEPVARGIYVSVCEHE